ncbi:MAG: glycosyl transferase family 1 [Bacteroidetes bacterium HGW-Bacteroidetes-21]|jgi:glycosyltransferase involved in cell wall biosynthesis|nr:MAG: glycosyl transferase family 1 [Bacteroidetes bacterium HGW-Bacteroidetes-21]
MRILQIHNKVPYPPKDGGSIAIWTLSQELAAQGHEVTLLAMNTKKHYVSAVDLPDREKSKIQIIPVDVNAPIHFYGAISNLLFSRLPYNAIRFIDNNFKKALIEVLQKNEFDVIQLEGLYVAPYIPVIRKYSKAVVSFRAHNVEHEIWSRIKANETTLLKREYLGVLVRRLKRFEMSLLNSADVVVPITERDASVFRTLGCSKPLHVCPAAINLLEVVPQPRKTIFPSLFFIGALDWAPNQEGLIWFFDNLWANIHSEIPEITLYVAGRNCPDWLLKKIQVDGVEYVGEVDNAYNFMNTYAIMIAPIFSGSGMRVKIIEGMALGKTIITTTIGTEGINTCHQQNILIANKADDFILLIKKCLENREFCDSIGKNAIEFVRTNYDIKSITKSLIKFYKHSGA